MPDLTLLTGDCRELLKTLPDQSVHCCVTSPPYWGLRDYGCNGQIGLEQTPDSYVQNMRAVFAEVWRVLRDDGTLWLNLGSSYYGSGKGGNPEGSPWAGFMGNKQREKSAMTSAALHDISASPSRQYDHVPACDNDDTKPQDSTTSDCVCSCLCDECRAVLSSDRNRNICPLHGQFVSHVSQIDRDNEHSGSSPELHDASLPVALSSTTLQSSRPHQGGCWHCSNCGVCLSVLRSSKRDARLCVRNSCLNYGIVYPRFKPKDLVPIPWMVAMALQADGWYLRSDIIWAKPNPMPESVTDRPTKAHEYLFLFSKNQRYYYDAEAIKEPSADPDGSENRYKSDFGGTKALALKATRFGNTKVCGPRDFDGTRNKRTVWTVTTNSYPEAHFATYPPDLIKPCILAGCPIGGTVLDPFAGSGTTGMVAIELGRRAILIELNPDYVKLAKDRCNVTPGLPLSC